MVKVLLYFVVGGLPRLSLYIHHFISFMAGVLIWKRTNLICKLYNTEYCLITDETDSEFEKSLTENACTGDTVVPRKELCQPAALPDKLGQTSKQAKCQKGKGQTAKGKITSRKQQTVHDVSDSEASDSTDDEQR